MSSLANEFSEKYSAKDISKFVRCLCGPGASSISSSSAAHASTDVIKIPPSGINYYTIFTIEFFWFTKPTYGHSYYGRGARQESLSQVR
jgi:hypothetical protein